MDNEHLIIFSSIVFFYCLFLSFKTTGLSQRHELNNGTNATGTPGELEFGKPENITNHATGMIEILF